MVGGAWQLGSLHDRSAPASAAIRSIRITAQERGLATVGGARQFYSVHGGNAYTGAEPLGGAGGSTARLFSLKPSSTAVNLSDMVPRDFSLHKGSVRCARSWQ